MTCSSSLAGRPPGPGSTQGVAAIRTMGIQPSGTAGPVFPVHGLDDRGATGRRGASGRSGRFHDQAGDRRGVLVGLWAANDGMRQSQGHR